KPHHETSHETHETTHNTGGNGTVDFGSSDDLARRRPGGPNTTTTNPTNTTTIVQNPGKGSGQSGVSGAEGPQDPYGGGTTVTDPGDGAAPDKKAEFYANLGQQQLSSGDTAGAAASFKKASELDSKNVAAVIGMGE